jgi:transposase
MARRGRSNTGNLQLHVIQANAAGVDVGADEIFVAVPADRDTHPVRSFPTFTRDLLMAADWLKACGVQTVAMESTGVYWIPFFQILEERGFKVFLVNARHAKNVPGRKTDVSDCQWIQYLHSVGLLNASFRPDEKVCAVRSLLRHRDSLVQMAAVHIQHMQKALDQMNLQLHHVISDITGLTGLSIIEALTGDYRREHLFTLAQSREAYRYYEKLMAECDREIEEYLKGFDTKLDAQSPPLSKPKDSRKPRRNELRFDLRTQLYRIFRSSLPRTTEGGSHETADPPNA